MTAHATLAKTMDEDQLLTAITEAMTLAKWRWHHVRRSDKALQMGHAGFPDVIAARAGRVLFIEVKSTRGTLTDDQLAWGRELAPDSWSVTWMVVRPEGLDGVLALIR